MNLRVMHYSGDRIGGAARAARRIHSALRAHGSSDSRLMQAEPWGDDPTLSAFGPQLRQRLAAVFKPTMDALPLRVAAPRDALPRSAGWSSRLTAFDVNSAAADVVHLHWICGGFLSVENIGRIRRPLVWTLHDMWAFCGAEHLQGDANDARWRNGYSAQPTSAGRFDIDRWVFDRKRKHWRQPMHIVTPSRWLADCVRGSALLGHHSVSVIPNPLDVAVFKPMERAAARRLLNLPLQRKLVLFGAIKGTQLPYKGWDLLMPALARISGQRQDVDAVIFGQGRPANEPALGMPIHWMGHLYDDISLAALYSAADVLVVPSRQESFGQTGSEAQACGCPVVAFDATGLRDVVAHDETGLLATPFDPESLSAHVLTLLEDESRRNQMGTQARLRAQRLWAYDTVAAQYDSVYAQTVGNLKHSHASTDPF